MINTMIRWTPQKQSGFTIVELLIVIVVIGILAAIVTAAYTGISNRAIATTLMSDLKQATTTMEAIKVFDGHYPTTIPSTMKSSPNVTLSLVASSLAYYSDLTAVQNGVLMAQICQDLVNEGKGRGTNLGGGSDDYITGCGNWNNGSMQVTGWTSRVFSTPINDDTFSTYAASVPAGDVWHPNQQTVTRNFYTELRSRLTTQGGSFPITTFWDAWATPGNGIMYQSLPAPNSVGNSESYCLQANYKTNGPVWYVRQQSTPAAGSC